MGAPSNGHTFEVGVVGEINHVHGKVDTRGLGVDVPTENIGARQLADQIVHLEKIAAVPV